MRIFTIDKNYSVVCQSLKTRSGFKHVANLMKDGDDTPYDAKVCYQNRTWEAHEYDTVLDKLCDVVLESEWIPRDIHRKFRRMIDNRTN